MYLLALSIAFCIDALVIWNKLCILKKITSPVSSNWNYNFYNIFLLIVFIGHKFGSSFNNKLEVVGRYYIDWYWDKSTDWTFITVTIEYWSTKLGPCIGYSINLLLGTGHESELLNQGQQPGTYKIAENHKEPSVQPGQPPHDKNTLRPSRTVTKTPCRLLQKKNPVVCRNPQHLRRCVTPFNCVD